MITRIVVTFYIFSVGTVANAQPYLSRSNATFLYLCPLRRRELGMGAAPVGAGTVPPVKNTLGGGAVNRTFEGGLPPLLLWQNEP